MGWKRDRRPPLMPFAITRLGEFHSNRENPVPSGPNEDTAGRTESITPKATKGNWIDR